jgi:membrane-bound lytic murein transglycosylase MltF
MPKWTNRDLDIQFSRAVNLGWLEVFKKASKDFDLPVEVLLAIASRETNLNPKYQQQTGDGGHGHSIMQIDDRSYPDFCNSGDWKDINLAIQKGASVLEEKRKSIRAAKGIPVTDEVRLAIAAYNCGATRVINNFRSGRPIDSNTTDKDYSADVLSRAKYFKGKLEEEN